MTSKEAFMDLIKLNLGKPLNNAGDNEIYKKMDLVFNSLEVLEILKPYFKGAVFPSAINFNFSEEEFKKLKEVFSK